MVFSLHFIHCIKYIVIGVIVPDSNLIIRIGQSRKKDTRLSTLTKKRNSCGIIIHMFQQTHKHPSSPNSAVHFSKRDNSSFEIALFALPINCLATV